MGQRRSRHNISNGIYPLNIGAEELIHLNLSALHLHAKSLKPKILCIWSYTNSREHTLHVQLLNPLLCLKSKSASLCGGINTLHIGRDHTLHTCLAEAAAQLSSHILILQRHNLVHILNKIDLRSHRVVEIGQLAAYGAGAYYSHRLRNGIGNKSLSVGENLLAVYRRKRKGIWS